MIRAFKMLRYRNVLRIGIGCALLLVFAGANAEAQTSLAPRVRVNDQSLSEVALRDNAKDPVKQILSSDIRPERYDKGIISNEPINWQQPVVLVLLNDYYQNFSGSAHGLLGPQVHIVNIYQRIKRNLSADGVQVVLCVDKGTIEKEDGLRDNVLKQVFLRGKNFTIVDVGFLRDMAPPIRAILTYDRSVTDNLFPEADRYVITAYNSRDAQGKFSDSRAVVVPRMEGPWILSAALDDVDIITRRFPDNHSLRAALAAHFLPKELSGRTVGAAYSFFDKSWGNHLLLLARAVQRHPERYARGIVYFVIAKNYEVLTETGQLDNPLFVAVLNGMLRDVQTSAGKPPRIIFYNEQAGAYSFYEHDQLYDVVETKIPFAELTPSDIILCVKRSPIPETELGLLALLCSLPEGAAAGMMGTGTGAFTLFSEIGGFFGGKLPVFHDNMIGHLDEAQTDTVPFFRRYSELFPDGMDFTDYLTVQNALAGNVLRTWNELADIDVSADRLFWGASLAVADVHSNGLESVLRGNDIVAQVASRMRREWQAVGNRGMVEYRFIPESAVVRVTWGI